MIACPWLFPVAGKAEGVIFSSCKTPAVTLNGKPVEIHPAENDLYRIIPGENGIIRFDGVPE